MRVLIAEDETLAAQRLKFELSRRGDVEIIGPFFDGESARAGIERSKPDVAILDVKMPGCSGFDVLQRLSMDRLPLVIFVTAFERFAISAFKVHALDFLLKPVDPDALNASLDRARQRLKEADAQSRARELMAVVAQLRSDADGEVDYETAFWVKAGGRNVRVEARDIEVAEAVRDYVALHTSSRSLLMRSTMTMLEERLSPDRFARVHRSFIVNLDHIRATRIGERGAHMLQMTSGREVRVGRTHAARLASRLKHVGG